MRLIVHPLAIREINGYKLIQRPRPAWIFIVAIAHRQRREVLAQAARTASGIRATVVLYATTAFPHGRAVAFA